MRRRSLPAYFFTSSACTGCQGVSAQVMSHIQHHARGAGGEQHARGGEHTSRRTRVTTLGARTATHSVGTTDTTPARRTRASNHKNTHTNAQARPVQHQGRPPRLPPSRATWTRRTRSLRTGSSRGWCSSGECNCGSRSGRSPEGGFAARCAVHRDGGAERPRRPTRRSRSDAAVGRRDDRAHRGQRRDLHAHICAVRPQAKIAMVLLAREMLPPAAEGPRENLAGAHRAAGASSRCTGYCCCESRGAAARRQSRRID